MKSHYDIVIIGAGPAGQKAAIVAASSGVSILVLDEQNSPGGQVYRSVERPGVADVKILGTQYAQGKPLAAEFREANVDYLNNATVWQVSQEREVSFTMGGTSYSVTGKQLILAPGAQERPFPIRGWTLPGVKTAGAAQVMLKSFGTIVDDAVFVGTGPLLYLVVQQYVTAGIPVKAVLDTTPNSNYWRALTKPISGLAGLGDLLKGLGWINEIRAANVPIYRNVSDVTLLGENKVDSIKFSAGNKRKSISVDNVFLHQGVIPNTSITQSLRCNHHWSSSQMCWCASTDRWCLTSIPDIAIAGDGASISGAAAATAYGAVAAIGALVRLNRLDDSERNKLAKPFFDTLKSELRFRPFLEVLSRPRDDDRIPTDDKTIVCRCEEVTTKQINDLVDDGCVGPNQLKSFSRCGMGPCAGRFCGLTVSELIAKRRGVEMEEVGYYRVRPPIKPVTLGELGAMTTDFDPSIVGYSHRQDAPVEATHSQN